jgi:glycosyltransferase involved in cell wall biosynthesis
VELMRVAVDVTPLRPPVTGVGMSVRHLLAALPGAAPEVEVVPWELTRDRTPLPPSLLLRLWAKADRPRAGRWLPEADIVHGTNYVVPPGRLPASVTVHDCFCARRPADCAPLEVAAIAAARRAVRRGAWLHVTTEFSAIEARELLGADERVVVVPFGSPDVAANDATSPVDGPYVLSIATLVPRKGLDTLVRAVAAAGVRLVLAGGDGPATPAVAAAIAETSADVVRLPHVTDPERSALLRHARVVAYAGLYEGFGFPVLEAMSIGVPSVATRSGGVDEVAGDAALLVDVGDVDGLAGALRQAWDDETLRADLIAKGQARAAGFTWDRTAAGLAELWRTAVAAG